MPLFFQHDIEDNTRLAIWQIGEEEDFFLRRVMPQTEVTHPHKKLQHLAGRYLLPFLFPQFPVDLIRIADTRKPYLEGEPFHFSISHSGNYAAAIVSTETRVGIDVELFTPKIERIAHKFVTSGEKSVLQAALPHEHALRLSPPEVVSGRKDAPTTIEPSTVPPYILVWSCKEAVFKWYGLGGMDFLEHMEINEVKPVAAGHFKVQMQFKKERFIQIALETVFFDDVCLSWIASDM